MMRFIVNKNKRQWIVRLRKGLPALAYGRFSVLSAINEMRSDAYLGALVPAIAHSRGDSVDEAAVFTILTRLHQDGLVGKSRQRTITSDGKQRHVTVYNLTEEGQRALEQSRQFYVTDGLVDEYYRMRERLLRFEYATCLSEAARDRGMIKPRDVFEAASSKTSRELAGRLVLARIEGGRDFHDLLSLANEEVTMRIVAHFKLQISATGSGVRALQVMHANRIVSRLPSGISALRVDPS